MHLVLSEEEEGRGEEGRGKEGRGEGGREGGGEGKEGGEGKRMTFTATVQ